MDPNEKPPERAYRELTELLAAAALLFLIFVNVIDHLKDIPNGTEEQKGSETSASWSQCIQQAEKNP